MAFSSTVTLDIQVAGNRRMVIGTWNADRVTGGDISTGLSEVESIVLGHTGSAVEAAVAVVNETLPLASGDVTIVTTSGDTGTFIAVGN